MEENEKEIEFTSDEDIILDKRENEKEIEFISNEQEILEKREIEKRLEIESRLLELSVFEKIHLIRMHFLSLDLVPANFNESTNVYQFILSDLQDIITEIEFSFGLCSIYTSVDECAVLRINDTKNKEMVTFQMYMGCLLKNNSDINTIFAIHEACKRMLYQNAYNISVKGGTSAEMILSEEDYIVTELKKMLGSDVSEFLNKLNVSDFKELSFETLKATCEVMKKDYEEKQKK